MRSPIAKKGAMPGKPFLSCGISHPPGIIDEKAADPSSPVDGAATAGDTSSEDTLTLPSAELRPIEPLPIELAGVDPRVLVVDRGVSEALRRVSAEALIEDGGAQFPMALTSLATTARRTPIADLAKGFMSFMVANRSTVQWQCCSAISR
jgi:hypothetical protein